MKKILFGLFFIFTGIIFAGEISVKSVSATSCLTEKDGIYKAEYLFDKSEKSWVEGEKGSGIGVEINIQFTENNNLYEFYIKNGFGDNRLYFENNRVKKMKAEFSCGRSAIIFLEDNPGFQKVVLSDFTNTDFIKLTILDVYRGTKYDDTAISEISFNSWDEIDHTDMNRTVVLKYSDDFYNAWKEYAGKQVRTIFEGSRFDNRHHEDTFLVMTRFDCLPLEDGSMYFQTEIRENDLGFKEEKDVYYYVLFFKWNGHGFEKAQNLIPYSEASLNYVYKKLSEIKPQTAETKILQATVLDMLKAKKENRPYANRGFEVARFSEDNTMSLEFKEWSFESKLSQEVLDVMSELNQKYVYHVPYQRLTKLILSPRDLK